MLLPIFIALCVVLLALVGVTVFLLIRKPRVGVIVLVVLLVTATAAVLSWKPIYKTRTLHFAEDIKRVADPSELQQWAVAILRETAQSNSSPEIPRHRIPSGIQNLTSQGSPFQDAFCDTGPAQDRTVWLVWGGGFGHWGIRVGAPSFRVSPDDDNYYVEWKSGIYFWHQTH
jgi:cell division protein FtsL